MMRTLRLLEKFLIVEKFAKNPPKIVGLSANSLEFHFNRQRSAAHSAADLWRLNMTSLT